MTDIEAERTLLGLNVCRVIGQPLYAIQAVRRPPPLMFGEPEIDGL